MMKKANRDYGPVYVPPPPPCEVFTCRSIELCRSQEMACGAFNRYMRTGKVGLPGIPNKLSYRRLFNGQDRTKRKPT